MGDTLLDARQMVDLTGVPYYQLNYWTGRGYLVATRLSPGSGHRLQWPASEVLIARLMRVLVGELEMSPGKASDVARNGGLTTFDDWHRVELRWEVTGGAGSVRDRSPRPGADRARSPSGVPG